MSVFVLGKNKKPLMPCSEKRARLLLSRGRAVVHLMTPFTIRLKDRVGGACQTVHVKIDPGSKQTGLGLVLESQQDLKVLWLAVLHHRAHQISERLTARRAMRWEQPVLGIKCAGRGSYQRTRIDKYGFPRGYLMRQKAVHGFQTGDRVKAIVLTGKNKGIYTGRVAVRASGSFNIQTPDGLVQGISHKHCTLIQRGSGYGFSLSTIALTSGGCEKQAA